MTPSTPDAEYAAFLRQGRFMIQRSQSSGRHVFPPRVAEPGTGARDLEWVEAKGTGTIYSVTEIAQRPPAPNTNVVLVDLDEGPRTISRVEGAFGPALPPIGARVKARIVSNDSGPFIVFDAL
ncbi:Zn-ribbon domain-containing OB-fold protein [Pseudorhodoferax sp.]|uniref:Zn-ribbon domain-containing OB-fold protein n=1 Tax=Pseudorhodoferax sp. TaxID=1993553 RepID=UPI002DD6442E|nr:OB-fold domain-containing protein [Pseudorhodoferax sp.]